MKTLLKVATLVVAVSPPALSLAAEPIEFWSNWPAAGELAAVNALVELANQVDADHPVTAKVVPGDFAGYRQQLQIATLGGTPPPAYIFNVGLELRDAVQSGRVRPLTAAWTALNGDEVFSAGLRSLVTFDGVPYAIPVATNVISDIWYNKKLFAELGLTPPTTWEEFGEVCDKLAAAGKECLANGKGPYWSFYTFYPSIIATMGVEGYLGLASGEVAFDSPQFSAALDHFRDNVAAHFMSNWTGGDWVNGADAVVAADVGMDLMGSWFMNYAAAKGAVPGEDIGYFPAPGMADKAIIQIDGLLSGNGLSQDVEAAADAFLEVAGSPAGQAALNVAKGALPANSLTSPDAFSANSLHAQMVKDLLDPAKTTIPNLSLLLPAAFSQDFGTAIERFAAQPTSEVKAMIIESLEAERQQLVADGKFNDWTE
ncbi:ABC transporter substrate-binding protein [Devosia yakushimensis]|uniref:ABC transporter substrate-binding protein n=1 Tax=Devosia yakushimensis TaxID=470028 RepID=A0ABQ5UJ31_9HYPH|nr:ABC transporter substrate-binding protein [Devosia yakushimensis]GLQ12094.1 ABC transporter substrate-binding protein [Devosia yakushimensis]